MSNPPMNALKRFLHVSLLGCRNTRQNRSKPAADVAKTLVDGAAGQLVENLSHRAGTRVQEMEGALKCQRQRSLREA
jgi:hypothetical protein